MPISDSNSWIFCSTLQYLAVPKSQGAAVCILFYIKPVIKTCAVPSALVALKLVRTKF